mgnify:CR=1 FL=1
MKKAVCRTLDKDVAKKQMKLWVGYSPEWTEIPAVRTSGTIYIIRAKSKQGLLPGEMGTVLPTD